MVFLSDVVIWSILSANRRVPCIGISRPTIFSIAAPMNFYDTTPPSSPTVQHVSVEDDFANIKPSIVFHEEKNVGDRDNNTLLRATTDTGHS